mgnify:FL=1|jgi:hypothetical protein
MTHVIVVHIIVVDIIVVHIIVVHIFVVHIIVVHHEYITCIDVCMDDAFMYVCMYGWMDG